MKKSKINYRLIFDDFSNCSPDIIELISTRLNSLLLESINFSLISEGDSRSTSDVDIYLNGWTPLIDERLIFDAIRAFKNESVKVKFVGSVHGTSPLSLSINGGKGKRSFYVGDQGIGGVNLNIKRPLRKKIYFSLIHNFPELKTACFEDVSKALCSDSVVDLVLRYGNEQAEISRINECPNCSSIELVDLYHSEGNTISGFLPNNVSLYRRCHQCELVFLSRQVATKDLGIYYTSEVYAREEDSGMHIQRWSNLTEENTSHYANYLFALDWIEDNKVKDAKVIDLGSGNGDFVALTKSKFPNTNIVAIDWFLPAELQNALSELKVSHLSVPISAESLEQYNFANINLVTLWEVIEHMKISDLRMLLDYIHIILRDDGALILSTPDFEDKHCQSLDFWAMAAGEHLSVFSESVLNKILNEHGFHIDKVNHESVTVKLPEAWYEYGETTSTHNSGRAASSIIEDFLKEKESREWYKRYCRKNNIGSEMIIVASKIRTN